MAWENYADKSKQLKAISDEAKKADRLILATDPDREGEAISWHVQEALRKKKALPPKVDRVPFNAIKNEAVTQAMKNPRDLDEDLIDANHDSPALAHQFGFSLSPKARDRRSGQKNGM